MSSESKSRIYEERIRRVCDYIYQHLDDELSLDQLSQVAHFSKYHFHRQFAEYVGISVARFIQLMRLKRASYRLAFDKEDKIIDIALEAQFENPESFSRAFKNTFDQTPTQFRVKPEWPRWHSKYEFTHPSEEESTPMNVSIVDFKDTKVALLQHRAAPTRVYESVDKFIEWRKQSKLSPVATSETYGIIYDNPKVVTGDDFRFDICGSVEQDVPHNPQGVTTGHIAGGRCAVLRHHGSHNNIGDKVHYLYRNWLPESGEELRDASCFFHYLNLITEVSEHDLMTDIYLPLK
ncbi:AraC family transcriptional regulator [Kaarinaea lacus]